MDDVGRVVRAAVVSDVRKRADGGRVDVDIDVRRVWMDDDDDDDDDDDSSGWCTNVGIAF